MPRQLSLFEYIERLERLGTAPSFACGDISQLPVSDEKKTICVETARFYNKVTDICNLYEAHRAARRGKMGISQVIEFEMNLARHLFALHRSLVRNTYRLRGYYTFMVHDPKVRTIHALHYADRVVQHCICDQVLAPELERRLIYDNAACRIGKGTDFALNRLTGFFVDFYRKHGTQGYILKCDIRKFFDNIDHDVLKQKLLRVFGEDEPFMGLLNHIIDSFEVTPGKGLPLGNQTSQWFAIYYLDSFDRRIKEYHRIKYYSRYMDDCIIIHHDKSFLKQVQQDLKEYIQNTLHLEFNSKTQIFPIQNGVDYLGWHYYLTQIGKVIKKLRTANKKKYKRRLKYLQKMETSHQITMSKVREVLASYYGHLAHGHTYKLQHDILWKLLW